MPTIIAHQVLVHAADYVHVNSHLVNALPVTKSLRRWTGGLSVIGIIGISIHVWQHSSNSLINILFFSALLIACLTYLLFGNLLVRSYLLRSYAKEQIVFKYPTDYTFTADSLSGHTELSDFTIKWSVIQRADLIGHWLLLYPTKRSYYLVNLNLLEPPASFTDLQMIMTTHHIPVRTLAA